MMLCKSGLILHSDTFVEAQTLHTWDASINLHALYGVGPWEGHPWLSAQDTTSEGTPIDATNPYHMCFES